MKTAKLFTLVLLSVLALSLNAQTDTIPAKKADTTNINLGNSKITIIEDKSGDKTHVTVTQDSTIIVDTNELPDEPGKSVRRNKKMQNVWGGVELGINGLLNADRSFSLTGADAPYSLDYAKSVSVSVNIFEQKIRLVKNNLYLSTGIGLEFNNFRFDNNSLKLNPDTTPLAFTYDTTHTYTKNKLTAAYLNVPLLLTVAANNKKGKNAFHISVGAMVGWKYRSHQKMVYNDGNGKEKPKEFDNFNMNPFRFTAMARMGYKNIGVYANYSLNSLFLKNQGPELYPLTMGVSLLF